LLRAHSSLSLSRLPTPLFVSYRHHHPALHSFPTRRSSDLDITRVELVNDNTANQQLQETVTHVFHLAAIYDLAVPRDIAFNVNVDRKSTRLNSSHVSISYAVFCLKK